MKKILIILFLFSTVISEAQFFRAVGIYGAGAISRHKWTNLNQNSQYPTTPETGYAIFIPNHKGKVLLGWGAGIVAEMLRYESIRWRTEIEYIKKGSYDFVTSINGSRAYGRNKLDYFAWNNFLIFRKELFSFVPYVLVGPRVEYTFVNAPQIHPEIIGATSKFHFSWSAGAGIELVTFGKLKPFLEYHYNPDILKLYNRNLLRVSNLTHEIRLGVLWRFEKRGEDCNSPVYMDNY